jgi:hypothetical protein
MSETSEDSRDVRSTVYLAGPISTGPDPFAWHEDIQSRWPSLRWINPFTQHSHSHSDADKHITETVERDLELVREADAVLLRRVEGQNLVGASIEAREAFINEIPVIVWNTGTSEIPLFLKGHATAVCDSLDTAVGSVRDLI